MPHMHWVEQSFVNPLRETEETPFHGSDVAVGQYASVILREVSSFSSGLRDLFVRDTVPALALV